MTIQRYESPLGLPFSRIVRAGGFVFFSGQLPMDSAGQLVRGDIKTQTHAVMERLRDNLTEMGLDFADVLKVTVWLTDLSTFPDFNEVYASYFKGAYPTRSTLQSGLVMDANVEVEIQALAR